MIAMIFLLVAMLAGTVAAESKLEITDLYVKVDGDKDSSADQNGGSFEIKPESEVVMKVEITNMYNDDLDEEDVEIEDIEVIGTIEDVDGDDIEFEVDDFDLNPGKDKTVTLEFDMPLRLETDEIYTLTLTVDGEDSNNTDHSVELQFDVEVDKENHELRFLQKEMYPTSTKPGSSSQLRVKLINTGEDDEEVTLTVQADDLGFSYTEDFDLYEDIDDDDNEYSYTTLIPVKKGTSAGTYPVLVRATYRDGNEYIEDTLNLVVEEVEVAQPAPTPTPTPTPTPAPTPEPEEEEEDEPEVQVISQPSPTYVNTGANPSAVQASNAAAVATPKTSYGSIGDSWWDRNKWITIILITDLILLIVGVAIVLAVLKKRRA